MQNGKVKITIIKQWWYAYAYHFVIKPIARFTKHYLLQLGILDGITGLTIASIQAYAVFLIRKSLATKKKIMNEELQKQLKFLNRGSLILYPTDTAWGIG